MDSMALYRPSNDSLSTEVIFLFRFSNNGVPNREYMIDGEGVYFLGIRKPVKFKLWAAALRNLRTVFIACKIKLNLASYPKLLLDRMESANSYFGVSLSKSYKFMVFPKVIFLKRIHGGI